MCSTKQLKSKLLFWTKSGLIELGRIIRASRERQGLTLVTAVALIKKSTGQTIGFRTLASIETSVGEPKYNTLAAIAYAGFVELGGRKLNIFDFIAIASENFEVKMNALAQLIYDYLSQQGLTLTQFAEESGVALPDLEAIMRGEETEDYVGDLMLIATYLTNPDTDMNFFDYEEMLEYCGMRKPEDAGVCEQSHVIGNGRGLS